MPDIFEQFENANNRIGILRSAIAICNKSSEDQSLEFFREQADRLTRNIGRKAMRLKAERLVENAFDMFQHIYDLKDSDVPDGIITKAVGAKQDRFHRDMFSLSASTICSSARAYSPLIGHARGHHADTAIANYLYLLLAHVHCSLRTDDMRQQSFGQVRNLCWLRKGIVTQKYHVPFIDGMTTLMNSLMPPMP